VEKQMIHKRVQHGLFQLALSPYYNPYFLVPLNNTQYGFIIIAVSTNQHTLEGAGPQPNLEEFVEDCTRLYISSPIDYQSE